MAGTARKLAARGGAGVATTKRKILGSRNFSSSESLKKIIERSGLLRADERVGVAVSGGADSVALLCLLAELAGRLGLTLSVLHFHHKLRGRAADADETFVARLAVKFGLPFYAGSADVRGMAARAKHNLEDAARRARYAFFAECAAEHHLNKVAVAHTADDQAETVLGHILRGSGLSGLAGIHPQRGNIVRPLLAASRAELRSYLKARKQTWREDASNRDATKTRARIRKTLVPLLQKKFQPRVVEHLASLAGHAREDDALLNNLADEYLAIHLEDVADGVRMRIEDLLGTALAPRLVRRMVREAKKKRVAAKVRGSVEMETRGELSALHVRQVLELAREANSGAWLRLPGGVVVRRYSETLTILAGTGIGDGTSSATAKSGAEIKNGTTGKSAAGAKSGTAAKNVVAGRNGAAAEFAYRIAAVDGEARVTVPELGCAFRFSVIDWVGARGETSVSGEVLNGARLRYPLILRNWRPGDRFRAQGHSKPQKLKRLLNAQRIDRWRRAGWPVLESQGELAWVRELGPAAEFVANAETRTGIVIVEEKSE